MRASVAGLRRRVPDEVAIPGRPAAADALLQPARRQSAARDGHREVAAGGDRPLREAGPHRTSDRALPRFTARARRSTAHRRGPAADHPASAMQEAEAIAAGAGRVPRHPGAALATRAWAATPSSTSPTRSSASAASGLRAYVALLEGSSPDDVVFLQLKQARRSVLAKYVHGDSAWHAHQGQRVVEYQQALQTVSDPLLGWTTVGEMQYYVRQFRNMKGTIPLDAIDPAALTDYAGIVGHLLAKGHARTSGASMIAGYVGASDKLDQALAKFARAYADQTEADHAALVKATRHGILPVADGALQRTGSSFRP